jgi:hypothetical protein
MLPKVHYLIHRTTQGHGTKQEGDSERRYIPNPDLRYVPLSQYDEHSLCISQFPFA